MPDRPLRRRVVLPRTSSAHPHCYRAPFSESSGRHSSAPSSKAPYRLTWWKMGKVRAERYRDVWGTRPVRLGEEALYHEGVDVRQGRMKEVQRDDGGLLFLQSVGRRLAWDSRRHPPFGARVRRSSQEAPNVGWTEIFRPAPSRCAAQASSKSPKGKRCVTTASQSRRPEASSARARSMT